MERRHDHVLWVEKYRPLKISDCILTKALKSTFQGIVDSQEVPNLLLVGAAGSGKTTIARAICHELKLDSIFINASRDRGIDQVRGRISDFAPSLALDGKRKVVILDEADNLTPDAQLALRASIEEFSKNCSFILTCNFKNKIIEPIHSRCSVKDFRISKDEKQGLIAQMYKRIVEVLEVENVKYDGKVLAGIVVKYYPDFRRTLNELQGFSKANNEINAGALTFAGDINTNKLYKALKAKRFNEVREWTIENIDNDPPRLYRKIYDGLKDNMVQNSIPQAIIFISDYQYKSAFVADPEINLLACLIEIMINCEFV
jgi:replication factor C small subunit